MKYKKNLNMEINEWCSSCGNVAGILWNTEEYGYKAYCPFCGEVLMICSECGKYKIDDGCDVIGGKCYRERKER